MNDTALLAAKTKFHLVTIEHLGVDSCARCGKKHAQLDWRSFRETFELDSYMIIGFAMCPQTAQPILWTAQDE